MTVGVALAVHQARMHRVRLSTDNTESTQPSSDPMARPRLVEATEHSVEVNVPSFRSVHTPTRGFRLPSGIVGYDVLVHLPLSLRTIAMLHVTCKIIM